MQRQFGRAKAYLFAERKVRVRTLFKGVEQYSDRVIGIEDGGVDPEPTVSVFWGKAVALTLGLSERTLQRKLRAEGTSFRELQEQVRSSLAIN